MIHDIPQEEEITPDRTGSHSLEVIGKTATGVVGAPHHYTAPFMSIGTDISTLHSFGNGSFIVNPLVTAGLVPVYLVDIFCGPETDSQPKRRRIQRQEC